MGRQKQLAVEECECDESRPDAQNAVTGNGFGFKPVREVKERNQWKTNLENPK
jgi:hypothetical protein